MAVGTQIKIDIPGKGATVAFVDSIETPTVRLKNGNVVKIRDIKHGLEIKNEIQKIRGKNIGAIFVEELDEIKDKTRPVIFSAHGVPKSVPKEAENKKMFYIDATCPLVTKVHREAESLHKNGYDVILIGHKNHPEVLGTMGQLPKGAIKLIETVKHAQNLNVNELKKPAAYVTQTTLSVDDTKDIINILKNRFPNIEEPKKEDICYATTNRQLAVKKIAPLCDILFVIGSKNSSNSLRLVEVAKRSGCKNTFLIDSINEYKINDLQEYKNIGITSGASAPEELVFDLINEIKKNSEVQVKEIEVAKESVSFKLPKILN